MTTTPPILQPLRKLRWRIGWRGLLLTILGLLTVLAVGVLILYLLWHARPTFWKQAQAQYHTDDSQQISRQVGLAVLTEQRVISSLYGQPGRYTLTFTEQDLNAWLAHRLQNWIGHSFSPKPPPLLASLGSVAVQIHEDRLLVALAYTHEHWEQVFTADFTILQRPDGQLIARADRILGGRLSIPIGPVAEGLEHFLREYDLEIWPPVTALRHGTPLDPRFPPNGWYDQRRWTIEAIKLSPQKVDLTLNVEDQHP
ncbi:MAG: hypothetical protein IT442_17140 [Phycisphaeraceae bacterium]|nr:hypothetical protein [Phycisphaeraceae bacterium]